jgi:hypothetical protein
MRVKHHRAASPRRHRGTKVGVKAEIRNPMSRSKGAQEHDDGGPRNSRTTRRAPDASPEFIPALFSLSAPTAKSAVQIHLPRNRLRPSHFQDGPRRAAAATRDALRPEELYRISSGSTCDVAEGAPLGSSDTLSADSHLTPSHFPRPSQRREARNIFWLRSSRAGPSGMYLNLPHPSCPFVSIRGYPIPAPNLHEPILFP